MRNELLIWIIMSLLVVLILVLIPNISAFDSNTIYVCGGDSETILTCIGDEQNSFAFLDIQVENPQTGIGNNKGGNFEETYDLSIICSEVNKFRELDLLDGVINYTLDQEKALRFRLQIQIGLGISEEDLKPFIEDFERYCPEYVIEIVQDKEKANYFWFYFIIILCIVLIVARIMYLRNQRISDY